MGQDSATIWPSIWGEFLIEVKRQNAKVSGTFSSEHGCPGVAWQVPHVVTPAQGNSQTCWLALHHTWHLQAGLSLLEPSAPHQDRNGDQA